MSETIEKNFIAIREALKRLDKKDREHDTQFAELKNILAAQISKNTALDDEIKMLKVRQMGSGPSVR